jgi:hypothetical protein
MTFISFITLITLITFILIIRFMVRCVKKLELPITCSRIKGLLLPKPLMTWGISFVLPWAPAGLPTFERPTRTTPPLLPARPWGRAPWWSLIESIVLLFATNSDPVWWWTWMPLASFFQWTLDRIAKFLFCNNSYIFWNKWNNSVINANNSHTTAQFRPFWNQLQLPWCFLNLKWHRKLSPAYLQCVEHF